MVSSGTWMYGIKRRDLILVIALGSPRSERAAACGADVIPAAPPNEAGVAGVAEDALERQDAREVGRREGARGDRVHRDEVHLHGDAAEQARQLLASPMSLRPATSVYSMVMRRRCGSGYARSAAISSAIGYLLLIGIRRDRASSFGA